MRPSLSLVIPVLSLATSVAAHGYVWEVTIDGQAYTGNEPNAPDNPSIIRQVDTISPVKGASNPFLNCGQNATLAANVAPANPGSQLTFNWSDITGFWPHNTGPMLTYMTSCGNEDCSSYNSSESEWFKIDEVGKVPGDNSTWLQSYLMNGAVANVTIPSNIAPGNYLIRHEIIALHLATSIGGAEFYPSCTQLTIGGNGTGKPTQSELVKLPGAYSDTDPGIYDPNVFTPNAPYIFPGPPVATFVTASGGGSSGSGSGSDSGSDSGSNGSGSDSGGDSGSGTSSAPPVPTSSTSTGHGSCQLKPTFVAQSSNLRRRKTRPHVISRIMRSWNLSL